MCNAKRNARSQLVSAYCLCAVKLDVLLSTFIGPAVFTASPFELVKYNLYSSVLLCIDYNILNVSRSYTHLVQSTAIQ